MRESQQKIESETKRMTLVKVGEILRMADKAKTSAIGFNCLDYNTIKSVISVAEELNKPAIVMLYPDHCLKYNWTTPEVFASMVLSEAAKVKVPMACIWTIAVTTTTLSRRSKLALHRLCTMVPCFQLKKILRIPGKLPALLMQWEQKSKQN
jgi:hypothetical protein